MVLVNVRWAMACRPVATPAADRKSIREAISNVGKALDVVLEEDWYFSLRSRSK